MKFQTLLTFQHLASTLLCGLFISSLLSSISLPGGIIPGTLAFHPHHHIPSGWKSKYQFSTRHYSSSSPTTYFDLSIDMPPAGSGLEAKLRFKPILPVPSEAIVVRYKIPFGLDVVPKDGMAICTKDGRGGEKVGDVLRYTSQWTLGLPQGDGVVSTAVAFSGGVRWQCTLFDVMKAKVWQQVVEALVSNTPQRTDEVVLVFERPLSSSSSV